MSAQQEGAYMTAQQEGAYMAESGIKICDECGSRFLAASSEMAGLCPECAHILYGYGNCCHVFENGRCIKCLWDGSKSPFTRKTEENEK